MNQTDETERALRAATCVGCKAGEHLEDLDGLPWHLAMGKTPYAYSSYPCTSKHAELLPLFQQAVEQATKHTVVAQDAAQDIRTGGVYRLENENMEVIRDAVKSVVAGAYAVAAKRLEHIAKRLEESMPPEIVGALNCRQYAKAILALTTADARQTSQQEDIPIIHGRAELEAHNERIIEEAEGRWQTAIYKLICKYVPDVDGSGCDSGDALDLTLTEIGILIAHFEDKQDAAIASAEARARDLEHAALDVIEWEAEYRKLNNLGRNPPSPFVALAIALAAARTPDSTKGSA